MNTKTLISILLIGIWSRITCVKCEVSELEESNFQNTIDNHLFVFVMFYTPIDWNCIGSRTHQPGFQNFEEAARVAKQNALTIKFDLKFGKVNVKDQSELGSKFNVSGYQRCEDPPHFILFRYSESTRYGSMEKRYGPNAEISKFVLSEHELTTQGMLDFLEKNTNPGIRLIETKEELDKFVGGLESTVIGYFQENSKSKRTFYKSVEKQKDYMYGTLLTKSLNEYKVDTIVATQEFGAKRVSLDKDLSEENIESFIESNAIPYILKLTSNNFQDEIEKNLLVFVIFYDHSCNMIDYFPNGALAAQENGIAAFLGLKFGKLNVKLDDSKNLVSKYNMTEVSGCGRQYRRMILFRYGKNIPYGAIDFSGIRSGIVDSKLETIKGMFEWLDKFTKPSVKIIQTDYELWRFVEFTEVTITGHFKDPRAKVRFWSAADKLKDYMWADISNMNPFETDTIIINQEYAETRLMMNDTLTMENIEKFVIKNANSSRFPVPTRTPRPDTDMEMDSYHREQKIVFIYDGSFFIGDFLQIKLKDSECIDTTKGNWTLGIRSARTFGQCLKIYNTSNCRPSLSTPQSQPGNPLILDDTNFPVHLDFGRAEFYSNVRSVSSCNHHSSASTASASAHTNVWWNIVSIGILTFMMLIT